jgi:hypothetical protein
VLPGAGLAASQRPRGEGRSPAADSGYQPCHVPFRSAIAEPDNLLSAVASHLQTSYKKSFQTNHPLTQRGAVWYLFYYEQQYQIAQQDLVMWWGFAGARWPGGAHAKSM